MKAVCKSENYRDITAEHVRKLYLFICQNKGISFIKCALVDTDHESEEKIN